MCPLCGRGLIQGSGSGGAVGQKLGKEFLPPMGERFSAGMIFLGSFENPHQGNFFVLFCSFLTRGARRHTGPS